MTRIRWTAIALVAALLGALACGGTSPGREPKPAYACDIKLFPPSKAGKSARWITPKATASCDQAPRQHVIELQIWRDTSGRGSGKGTWAQEKGIDNHWFAECREIPTPGHPVTCPHKQQPWQVACKTGTWRYQTRATVTGTAASGRSFAFTPSEKPIGKITC